MATPAIHHPKERDKLIVKLREVVGETQFVYGESTAIGDAECTLFLTIDKDADDHPRYFGTICTPSRLGTEAEGIVLKIEDETGDSLASGRTGPRGRFSFTVDPFLVKQHTKCHFKVDDSEFASELPVSVYRRRARSTPVGMAGSVTSPQARTTDQGSIRLNGNRLWIRIPSFDVPYDLMCVVAIQKAKVVGATILPMPKDESVADADDLFRENGFDIRNLIGHQPQEEFDYDAWPITKEAETRRHISDGDIRALIGGGQLPDSTAERAKELLS